MNKPIEVEKLEDLPCGQDKEPTKVKSCPLLKGLNEGEQVICDKCGICILWIG